MMEWKKLNWNLNNAELARQIGTSKQKVAYHRKRLSIPNAASHGGRREGSGQGMTKIVRINGVSRDDVKQWHEAHAAKGQSFEEWAIAALNAKSKRDTNKL